jgi:hypothetical protein
MPAMDAATSVSSIFGSPIASAAKTMPIPTIARVNSSPLTSWSAVVDRL